MCQAVPIILPGNPFTQQETRKKNFLPYLSLSTTTTTNPIFLTAHVFLMSK
jgi:hypothetical protein